MASHEVDNRNALRSLIAASALWQSWTGLNEAGALLRIGWPESLSPEFPCIVIVTLAGGRTNDRGSDSSANFRSRGGLGVIVLDRVGDEDDLPTSDDAFAENFFELIDEIVEAAHETELMIEDISYEDNPYRISSINTSHPSDDNEDGDDDEETITQLFFEGNFRIQTGVA